MTDRETIIELLSDVKAKGFWEYGTDCRTGEKGGHDMTAEDIADYLLGNGVTVQEWISVKDRLPDTFGEYIVTVEAIGGELYTDHADYDPFAKKWITGLYRLPVEEVTHWMPLPQPPKGE